MSEADRPPDSRGWGSAGGVHYRELLRGGAEAEDALPMLVVFHGMEGSPSVDYLDGLDVNPGVRVRVIRPQGLIPVGGYGFSWFDERLLDERSDADKASGIQVALERVVAMLEALRAQRPTRGRVFVTGFSQGGMLSYALAAQHPELVEVAVPVAGYLPQPLWPTEKAAWVPHVHALHGTQDDIVSFERATSLVGHLGQLGYDSDLTAFEGIDHQVAPAMGTRAHDVLSAAITSAQARTAE